MRACLKLVTGPSFPASPSPRRDLIWRNRTTDRRPPQPQLPSLKPPFLQHAAVTGACAGWLALMAGVLKLVVANLPPPALADPERKALRQVCRDARDELDAFVLLGGLKIRVNQVPKGADGAQHLARFFGRPCCVRPTSITIIASLKKHAAVTEPQL